MRVIICMSLSTTQFIASLLLFPGLSFLNFCIGKQRVNSVFRWFFFSSFFFYFWRMFCLVVVISVWLYYGWIKLDKTQITLSPDTNMCLSLTATSSGFKLSGWSFITLFIQNILQNSGTTQTQQLWYRHFCTRCRYFFAKNCCMCVHVHVYLCLYMCPTWL